MRSKRPVYRMMAATMFTMATMLTTVCLICFGLSMQVAAQAPQTLTWRSLPPIPDELGLAGPIVGMHDDVLIVGGGANFARPVWDHTKQWHSRIYALDLRREPLKWASAGNLPSPMAYSACASTPGGVVVIGGNDDQHEMATCWLLKVQRTGVDRIAVQSQRLRDLPVPLVYGQAVWMRDRLIVASGQTGTSLTTATASGWELWLDEKADATGSEWHTIEDCPGGPRAFAMMSPLPGDTNELKLLLMGGRRQTSQTVEFLDDVWQYDLASRKWLQMPSLPVRVTAGGAGPLGLTVAILSGDDGKLFTQTEQLKDNHPGFAKRTWLLDRATGKWQTGGPSPANQVTTTPVSIGNRLIIASGEVRPRVRTSAVWEVSK